MTILSVVISYILVAAVSAYLSSVMTNRHRQRAINKAIWDNAAGVDHYLYEANACAQAWLNHPDAQWGWCCHHDVEYERVDGLAGAIERIFFILVHKDPNDRLLRFRNFRPIVSLTNEQLDKAAIAPAEIAAAHAADVPAHTWHMVPDYAEKDGTIIEMGTIFGG